MAPAVPIWPYPVMFAGWLVHNAAFQAALILLMSLWFLGWVGTLFLSSTRVIFAAAFDRVLPDRAAEVSEKRKVPFYSLILMLLPAVGAGRRLRLLDQVPDLHAGRHPGDRGDLPVQRDRGGHPALAQARPVACLASQQGQAVRGADRPGRRGGSPSACSDSTCTGGSRTPHTVSTTTTRCVHAGACTAGGRGVSWSPGSCAGGRASTWASSTRRSRSSSLGISRIGEGPAPPPAVRRRGRCAGRGSGND